MQSVDNGQVANIKAFVGRKDLLITGTGRIAILKSLDGENYHPLTTTTGELQLTGNGVIYNDKIENDNGKVTYQLKVLVGDDIKWEIV